MNSNIDIAKRLASSLDCQLTKESLKLLAEILVPEKYKKGERILDEGQVCNCLYFIDKGMTKTEMRLKADISTTTLAKLGKNETVSMEVLLKICKVLACNVGDIIDVINEGTKNGNE